MNKNKKEDKRGRPQKYKKEYSEMVYDYLCLGKSLNRFAHDIGVSRPAIHLWISKHKEFNVAVKKGMVLKIKNRLKK